MGKRVENTQQQRAKRPVGRPAKHRKLVGLMLPPEVDEALVKAAEANRVTKSDFAIHAIKKSLPKELRGHLSKGQKLRMWPQVSVTLSPEQMAELRTDVRERGRRIGDVLLEAIERHLEERRRQRNTDRP